MKRNCQQGPQTWNVCRVFLTVYQREEKEDNPSILGVLKLEEVSQTQMNETLSDDR